MGHHTRPHITKKKIYKKDIGSEANIEFGYALMPSYLEMCPLKGKIFSFRMQPLCEYPGSGIVLKATGSQFQS